MELHEAMAQISEIRLRMAEAETFRGYRSATVAFTGMVAFVAGALQLVTVPEPSVQFERYLTLWVGAAVLAGAVAGAEMLVRCRRAGDRLTGSVTRLALEQFSPCLVAGGMLTAVIAVHAPEAGWMLPGLWQILFALGIFASCRLLPRPTAWAGAFYLVGGVTCLIVARGPAAFSPWAMALPFGVGQWLTAAILYWNLERGDGPR